MTLSDALQKSGDSWIAVSEPIDGAVHAEVNGQLWASNQVGKAEAYIASWCRKRLELPVRRIALRPNHSLSDSQVTAAKVVLEVPVAALDGGPGTGKTYTAKEIVAAYLASGLTVYGCAFTGAAASRLSETTGIECSTIHRLIGWDGVMFTKFVYYDVLIIDECSMLSNSLLLSVCSRLSSKTRLLLIGDQNQLYGVDPGSIFEGLASVIPCGHLSEIRRTETDSPIGVAAQSILAGKRPDTMQGPNGGAFLVLSCNGLRQPSPGKYESNHPLTLLRRFAEIDGVDPDSIRTLATSNDRVKTINAQIASALGPLGPWMAIKNLYKGAYDDDIYYDIFNGDIGIAHQISKYGVDIDFGQGIVTLGRSCVEPARCTTVNKVQGREYPIVQTWVESCSTRRGLYTAATRAKRRGVLVGPLETLGNVLARPERPRLSLFRPLFTGSAKFYDNDGADKERT